MIKARSHSALIPVAPFQGWIIENIVLRATKIDSNNFEQPYSQASDCLATERLDNNVWSAVDASRFSETEVVYAPECLLCSPCRRTCDMCMTLFDLSLF